MFPPHTVSSFKVKQLSYSSIYSYYILSYIITYISFFPSSENIHDVFIFFTHIYMQFSLFTYVLVFIYLVSFETLQSSL